MKIEYLTLGEAAIVSGKSKAAISRAITTGKLGAIWDRRRGCYAISQADLFDVYPQDRGMTLRAAADHVGKSKSTVLRAIQSGRVQAEMDEFGRYNIEPESVEAAYPRSDDFASSKPLMAAIAAAGMWNNPRYKNASFSTIAKMAVAHADVLIAELAKGDKP